MKILCCFNACLIKLTQHIDFVAPLAMRLFLVPVFWMAGMNKFNHMADTITWFGNAQWGLGLPFPTLLAYLATYAELAGAICLAAGFLTRWICIPLLITMGVAIFSVHIDHGWLAIAAGHTEAHMRLQGFLTWLKTHYPMRHSYITEFGSPVILNNGVEFATTYSIMLFSLLITGAGRFVSVDYWLGRCCHKKSCGESSKKL